MADIVLKNLVKIYDPIVTRKFRFGKKGKAEVTGTKAIDGVDIVIPSGSFTILLGPSGCGKTTLLRMIAGLEVITSGQILMGDIDITNLDPGDRGLAMVFQSYALYPHMTVKENIEFGLKNARIPRFEIAERVKEALETVGLTEYADRRPSKLSGGQRQRVALARAISKYPQCFLMDEPLSNLDAKLRSEMRSELISLHQKLQSTFIYVTHDQIEAMTMGTNVVILHNGKVMQQGKPESVYNDPNCVFVAKFIGDPGMNIIECKSGYKIGFRSRDIVIDDREIDEESVRIEEKIHSFENHGAEFLYLINLNDQKVFIKELSKERRQIGDTISFSIKRSMIYVFDEQEMRVYDDDTIERVYREFKSGWHKVQ